MVVDVVLSLAVHQPRRLKLPAQPIPRCASLEDLTRCLFDERLNERYFRQVAQSSYYPAARMFLQLVREQGLRLALSCSLSFVRQAALWEPALLDLFRELAAEEAVELVGVDPYRSLHDLLDLPGFVMRLRWMAEELEQVFSKRPTIIDTSDLGMSTSLYHALDAAGLQGAFIESYPQVMQWRSSSYLYRSGNEEVCASEIKPIQRARRSSAKVSGRDRLGPPYTVEEPGASAPYLLTRHTSLSADISARFSNPSWPCYPLYADVYARWLAGAHGDYVLLGWDLATFGAHQSQASGIFEFMQALPRELGRLKVATRTPSEVITRLANSHAYYLPLPRHTPVWASFSNPDHYFEYDEQRVLFGLMHDLYNLARLTENPDLLDLAIWLMQADIFHQLQWPGPHLAHATLPPEWSRLGAAGLLREQKQVYLNALYAFEAYLPARVLRQSSRTRGPAKTPSRPGSPSKEPPPAPESKSDEPKEPPKTSRRKKAPAQQQESGVNKDMPKAARRPTKRESRAASEPETPGKKAPKTASDQSGERQETPKVPRRKKAPIQHEASVVARQR